jgi:hypothetical protein
VDFLRYPAHNPRPSGMSGWESDILTIWPRCSAGFSVNPIPGTMVLHAMTPEILIWWHVEGLLGSNETVTLQMCQWLLNEIDGKCPRTLNPWTNDEGDQMVHSPYEWRQGC